MKINADFHLPVSVRFDPNRWNPSPALGVDRFFLDRIGSERARATSIVRYQSNSHFPLHTHVGGEEFLVLRGTFYDEHGVYPTGSYVRNPIDTAHAPWVEQDGCTIFVKLLQMAEPISTEDATPLHIPIPSGDWWDAATTATAGTTTTPSTQPPGRSTSYGRVLDLYHNVITGERVQMYWIRPGQQWVTTDDDNDDDKYNSNGKIIKSCEGGEEWFVVKGSFQLLKDSNETNHQDQHFEEWSWLRFPPTTTSSSSSSSTRIIVAGSEGLQLYRKTGHLTEQARQLEKIQITLDSVE